MIIITYPMNLVRKKLCWRALLPRCSGHCPALAPRALPRYRRHRRPPRCRGGFRGGRGGGGRSFVPEGPPESVEVCVCGLGPGGGGGGGQQPTHARHACLVTLAAACRHLHARVRERNAVPGSASPLPPSHPAFLSSLPAPPSQHPPPPPLSRFPLRRLPASASRTIALLRPPRHTKL